MKSRKLLCYNVDMNKLIDEDIKNNTIKKCYLIFGEEDYLKRQNRDKLKKALVPEGDTMNFSAYEGKNINIPEIIDLAETLPFFAEKRTILLENTGFCKGSAPEELIKYLAEIPESAVFIFVENEVDKRSKLYKAIAKYGLAVEYGRETEETLTKWVLSRIKKEGKNITKPVMQSFFVRTGNDMENIDKELEKLLCYTMERDIITEEDLEAVCTGQLTKNIFEMVNAIAEKNRKRAFSLYYELLEQKEAPMHVLYLVNRQFNNLLRVKDLKNLGYDPGTISSKTGIVRFGVQKNLEQARGFTMAALKKAVSDGIQAEEDIKSGRMDERTAVELFLSACMNG